MLAEGVNLHRANIVINYDLPWNPTRVLQRVGRVNRVGTQHKEIHIFNFFPTSQSDEHLGLEANIKAKIQAFHDMLGEDAKYLTEEEEVSQHELFGDHLYSVLNRKESYLGEDGGERSELEFLQVIRDVRDHDPKLFEKIKRLPKKARSGRVSDMVEAEMLVSFFRRGRLKKFYLTSSAQPQELVFMDAADLLRCGPGTSRQAIPKAYYAWLAANKAVFAEATSPESEESATARGGSSNVNYILRYLKAIRRHPQFTDEEETYVQDVIAAFDLGIVPKQTSQTLKRRLEKETDPLKALALLRKHLPDSLIYATRNRQTGRPEPVEVILSAYLQPASSASNQDEP